MAIQEGPFMRIRVANQLFFGRVTASFRDIDFFSCGDASPDLSVGEGSNQFVISGPINIHLINLSRLNGDCSSETIVDLFPSPRPTAQTDSVPGGKNAVQSPPSNIWSISGSPLICGYSDEIIVTEGNQDLIGPKGSITTGFGSFCGKELGETRNFFPRSIIGLQFDVEDTTYEILGGKRLFNETLALLKKLP